jgi:hypothetical protein
VRAEQIRLIVVSPRGEGSEDPIQVPPPQPVPSACVTPAGVCSLPPGPVGVICACFTPFGPIQGFSR